MKINKIMRNIHTLNKGANPFKSSIKLKMNELNDSFFSQKNLRGFK